jgi:hypothetical protein
MVKTWISRTLSANQIRQLRRSRGTFAGCSIEEDNREQENCHPIATRHRKTGRYGAGQPPAPFIEISEQI